MEVHVLIPSPSHFLLERTLISSILVRRCPPIVAQRASCHGRRKKRKRPYSLSPVLKRLIGHMFSTALLNPRILPPPLDLISEEFLGRGDDGNGGKSGDSGYGWWWWDWRGWRGLKSGLGFWLVVILIRLSIVIVKEMEIDPQSGVLVGLGLGIGVMGFIEKLTRDYYWVLGFCCLGMVVVLGLGLNKEVTSYAGKFLSGANQWRGTTRRRNRKRFLVFRK